MRIVPLAIVGALVALPATPLAQARPQPSKPAKAGPTLTESLGWLQRTLKDNASFRLGDDGDGYDHTDLVEFEGCRVVFEQTVGLGNKCISGPGNPQFCLWKDQSTLVLNNVVRVTVRKRQGARSCVKMATLAAQVVRAHLLPRVDVLDLDAWKVTNSGFGDTVELCFSDESVRDRVVKAVEHAARLCGAKLEPEPF